METYIPNKNVKKIWEGDLIPKKFVRETYTSQKILGRSLIPGKKLKKKNFCEGDLHPQKLRKFFFER